MRYGINLVRENVIQIFRDMNIEENASAEIIYGPKRDKVKK
jgi:hypothetical protein